MKIIQSLWSRPMLERKDRDPADKYKGGWIDRKYHYMSWALSCLQFRKFYPDITLITDEPGYELLIDRMGLPYSHVELVLDNLNEYEAALFALGKIYAYSLQDQPFIHVDGDIFIWERLDPLFDTAPLIAQNIEDGFTYYDDIFKKILQEFDYVPEMLERSRTKNGRIVAVNAGLLGGSNMDFFKSYTEKAFEFIDRNRVSLGRINLDMFNVIFEQFLFHAMAEDCDQPIAYYKNGFNAAFDGLADLTDAPAKIKFVHPVRPYKQQHYIGELIGYHLQKDHPDYYYRIVNLMRTHQL